LGYHGIIKKIFGAIAFTIKIWSQQDNGIAKLALQFLYFGSWIPNDYRSCVLVANN